MLEKSGQSIVEADRINLTTSGSSVTLFVRLCCWSLIDDDDGSLIVNMTRYCYCTDEEDDNSCSFPGPTLEMKGNTTINVTLVNQLTGSAEFYGPDSQYWNQFKDMDITNLHVHGLHVSPTIDDVLLHMYPMLPQNELNHSHSYLYAFGYHFPGTYWYHAHNHGSVAWQINQGLHGAIIMYVNDSYQDYITDTYQENILQFSSLYIIDETICIEDDVTCNNLTALNISDHFTQWAPCFVYCEMPEDQRYASGYRYDMKTDISSKNEKDYLKILVNGQLSPVIDDMTTGHFRRLRMINSLSSYFLQMKFPEECDWYLIATDGIYMPDGYTNYNLNKPAIDNNYIMAPGGRVDMLVKCAEPGNYQVISSQTNPGAVSETAFSDGHFARVPSDIVLFTLEVIASSDSGDDSDTVLPTEAQYTPKPAGTYVEKITDDDVVTECNCNLNREKYHDECVFSLGMVFPKHDTMYGDVNGQPFEYNLSQSYPYTQTSLSLWEMDKAYEFRIDCVGAGSNQTVHPYHQHTNPFQVVEPVGNGFVALPGTYWDTLGDYTNKPSVWITARTWTRDYSGLIILHCHEVQHSDHGLMGYYNIMEKSQLGECDNYNDQFGSAAECWQTVTVTDFGEVVGIAYATAYIVLLIGIIALFYDKNHSVYGNFLFLWKKRGIYGPAMATIFDHASDMSVLVVWYEYYQISLEHSACKFHEVGILYYIVASLCILVFTRLFEILTMTKMVGIPGHSWNYFDFVLALFDLYSIKQVYLSHKQGSVADKPKKTAMLELTLLNEVLLESIPEIVLQSMFIIYNSELVEGDEAIFLVSIFFSLISASHKVLGIDATFRSFDSSLDRPQIQKEVRC